MSELASNELANELTLVTGEPAELLFELGSFPVAHKFVPPDATEEDEVFPLRVGIGKETQLVGLIDPPPWQALTPIYPWIVCNEPEDHLDNLADIMVEKLADMPADPTIVGLSDKDRTLIQRLHARLSSRSHSRSYSQSQSHSQSTARSKEASDEIRLFSHPMLDAQVKPGVEVVQAAMSLPAEQAGSLQEHSLQEQSPQEQYDLIVGRHILEHTSNTQAFLARLQSMLTPNGVAVLEVPDNAKAFDTGQHTVIWEEHSLYFTEATLKALLHAHNMRVVDFYRYPMALEDILVAVVAKQHDSEAEKVSTSMSNSAADKSMERHRATQFATMFTANTEWFQSKLTAYREQYGKVAILGAGHLGAAFVNFYRVGSLIDAVIDDDPNKHGLLLPGCRLPIIGSESLNKGEYGLCLLTCNPWNNDKIAARNQGFLAAGGTFLSVFEWEKWA